MVEELTYKQFPMFSKADKIVKASGMRKKFNEEYGSKSSDEIQKEILYQLLRSNSIAEKTRSNTSTLITWLVLIPIIMGSILWILAQF